MHTSVLIVGAGPTGLMAAQCLQKHGIAYRLIDREPAPSRHSKALVIQPRTLEVFQTLGIEKPFIDAGWPLSGANIYLNRRPRARIDFSTFVDSPYRCPLAIAQSHTERLLAASVKVERQTTLSRFADKGEQIEAYLISPGNEEVLTADWLLACDGSHSQIRRELRLPFTGSAVPHYFLLADFKTTLPFSNREIHGFLSSEGIVALFPFEENTVRVVANLPTQSIDASAPQLTVAYILDIVKRRTGVALAAEEALWISPFKINSRMTEHLQRGRVFLLGDAFHIHSPVAGQGMNTGLQDAHNLAWKLAAVIQGQEPPSLLTTYEIERKKNARRLLKKTAAATTFIETRNPLLIQIRNGLLRFFSSFSFMRKKATRAIAELDIDYRHSPLSRQIGSWPWFSKAPRPGERLPPRSIEAEATGKETTLQALLDYRHKTALLFSGSHSLETERREALRALPAGYTLHTIELPTKSFPMQSNRWIDPGGEIHRKWKLKSCALFLIRPDGYVELRSMRGKA